MRGLVRAVIGGALVAVAVPAFANTIDFGTPVFVGGCSLSGNSADRSCTHAAAIDNAGVTTASAQVVGQASADHGLTTNATAIADITVSYDIPYTVTRTVTHNGTVTNGGPATIEIPTQIITLNMNFSGSTAHDNSQLGGGLANATAFTASVLSLGIPGAGVVWAPGATPAAPTAAAAGRPRATSAAPARTSPTTPA